MTNEGRGLSARKTRADARMIEEFLTKEAKYG